MNRLLALILPARALRWGALTNDGMTVGEVFGLLLDDMRANDVFNWTAASWDGWTWDFGSDHQLPSEWPLHDDDPWDDDQ